MPWSQRAAARGLRLTLGMQRAVYDLKAVNPNRKTDTDTRIPEKLLALIEAKGREIAEVLALLRAVDRP